MDERRTNNYVEISEEIGKRLIKLYRAKIFPRQGKVFADMLFTTGVEAGTYIASLANIENRAVKINLATNALIKLNQTAYLIKVMKYAGYYSPSQVVNLEEYTDSLIKAVRHLLVAASLLSTDVANSTAQSSSATAAETQPESAVTVPIQPVAAVSPAVQPAEVKLSRLARKKAKKLLEEIPPDGLNDPV